MEGVMKGINRFLEGIWWEDDGVTCRWKYTSNGIFSVKSAYDVIKSSSAEMGEQSDSRRVHAFWKKLWSSKVPNKIKVFCWRMFHNSLPDAMNLRRRGIDLDCRCKRCGFQNETALHVVTSEGLLVGSSSV
ncbi:hypothetical protein QQ045_014043 [Rhodiola kirilowii]